MKCKAKTVNTRIRRSLRAISPVISVLMMIAIAVAASLVAYAWVMGYIGGTTNKIGKAVMIQSVAPDGDGNLMVYVQNVGVGAVDLDSAGCVYVNDVHGTVLLFDDASPSGLFNLPEGNTVEITVDFLYENVNKVKAVTTDGAYYEKLNIQQTSGGGGGGGTTQFTLTIGSLTGGTGTGSVNPAGGTYDEGAEVEVTATADGGSVFVEWGGDLSGSENPTTIIMDGDKTITAIFNIPQQVTYVGAGTAATALNTDVRPRYPSGALSPEAGDLIILQVLARGDSPTITVPIEFTPLPLEAGWTYDTSGTGTGARAVRVEEGLYYKWATGGESGQQITVSVTGPYSRGAQIYVFRNVATSNFLESVTNPANTETTTSDTNHLRAQSVTTSGPKRLAVTFIAAGDNPSISTFGGYIERAEINCAYGTTEGDASKSKFGLDTAEMANPDTLNPSPISFTYGNWIVRSFALVPG